LLDKLKGYADQQAAKYERDMKHSARKLSDTRISNATKNGKTDLARQIAAKRGPKKRP
jgi:hypothetical protein